MTDTNYGGGADHASELDDGEFVRIEYTARTAAGDRVVDTTDPAVATDADLAGIAADGPVVVVLGEGHLFEPVKEAVREAGVGGSATVTVEPSDAFGERDPRKVETVPVELVPSDRREAGREVSVAGRTCVIESVDEETATLDYNHALAGVTLEYEVSVSGRVPEADRPAGLCALHGLDADVTLSERELSVSVTATEPSAERDRRRRAFVRDAKRLLPVDSVTVAETYEK
ncbi:FKBP-type peptidylprolyl isomerase [Halorubrum sp. BOL3-1]|uniref:FKBP-type peptidyl-prolyl cis-trans isomerase n=1 Tax=Halorubrum sp. BOL3-1 TaxID=2497325 RepID=UPI001004DDD4|nr:FKBP-type peptidyl-prolyl cis-trans isomerase [Halorubrum sp. BOL3-1]QAU14251.1 FKBP-type peptidylprolyl isomerase [Halorubrum sp. BOL3-1]